MQEWLNDYIFPREAHLDDRAVKAAAQLAIAECLRFGVTSVSDMYDHCDAICQAVAESNKLVTGSVKLKLYKGNIIPAGTTSPYSLYSEELVTFGESDYDQAQAAGFINIWGLPTQVEALREQGKL